MGNGVFVAGTDTGVGKTLVSAALVRRLVRLGCSAGVMKPVETGVSSGSPDQSDAARLMATAHVNDSLDLVSPYRFPLPLAPLSAASAERQRIDQDLIMDRYEQLAVRHHCMVVEGAGGLLVPMGQDWDLRELIVRLRLPVILVGRVGLGGINHALLTLEALEHRKIPVVALMLNEPAFPGGPIQAEQQRSTVALLRERVSVPLLGPLPYQSRADCAWPDAVDAAADSLPVRELAEMVLTMVAGRS
ncbi:MAG: dethiobiotin synthase [Nitrospira sp.]|uniref:ATP-dependent dethiobiotin synthetase BioD n=1 Tax=Nitrospira defluvii TaxID=330214 RepID=A0ABN7LXE0_9BACT|nr:dethiobiotin synthase [Nitrospira defluvii]MCS6329684.1 dethiobiotin synthase [Nitrospira sp.]CAE6773825.1 ATP-dependent dethiobiotin synthetase BioD [Nitrospira defluvii]